MATARMLATAALETATVRQFRKAALIALAAVGLGGLIYLVETFVLDTSRRFVESPADVMMRGFGLAHFWVGWLFLLTSPRLRSWPSAANLAFWTLLGALACLAAWLGGGARNPLFLMAFYAYFLVHEIRDEASLFQAYGDAPAAPAAPTRDAFLRRLAWSVTLGLMALLATAYTVHGRMLDKLETMVAAPLEVLAGLVAATWLAAAVSGWGVCRFARRHGVLWSDYAPLLTVYLAIAALLGVGSLLGSFGFNLIVLVHVSAWLVFTHDRLARQPRPGGRGWAWLRGTPAGFVTLHAAAALLVLVLMALRVHLWERAGWISVLFATSSFPYWSVMHITMAFWRPK
jgi:hypothetical protein